MLYSECDRGMREDGDGSSGDSLVIVVALCEDDDDDDDWDDACGGMVLGVSSHSESPNIVLSNCMGPTTLSFISVSVCVLFVFCVSVFHCCFDNSCSVPLVVVKTHCQQAAERKTIYIESVNRLRYEIMDPPGCVKSSQSTREK